jgi:hypothetical protein
VAAPIPSDATTFAQIASQISQLSPLIAGLFLIVGAWYQGRTNRTQQTEQLTAATDRQREQLAHDALQRDRERQMALRRDVYLPAIESITHLQGMLGHLVGPDTDISSVLGQLQESLATISKVHLVSNIDTMRAVLTYVGEFVPALLDLVGARAELLAANGKAKSVRTFIDQASQQMAKHIEELKQMNLEGVPDAARWQRVNEQYQLENNRRNQLNEQLVQAAREYEFVQVKLSERMSAHNLRLAALIPEALLAARAELELHIDGGEVRVLFKAQQEAVTAMMARNIRDRRQRLAPPGPPPPPAAPQA